MNINFSEVFKRLRKEKDLTQEQAAEIFGVSPQAVSRWECAQTSPDITILPVIAEYFGVTIEQLLGVESERRKALHKKYMTDFDTAINSGKINDCIEIARAGLKDFPQSYELMNALMYALFASGDETGNIPEWKENQEKYNNEITSLGEQIIEGCTDDNIRLEAKARLGFHYCEDTGELDKGRKIFESLPEEGLCKENYIYWALRGNERIDHIRRRICSSASDLKWNIWKLICSGNEWKSEKRAVDKEVFSPQERIKYMQVIEDIEALIFNEEDHGLFYRTLPREYFSIIIPDLISLGMIDDAISYSEKACNYMEKFCGLPDKFAYTSPLVEGVTAEKEWHTADSRPEAQIVYEDFICRDCYDAIKNEPRFLAVTDRIKALF